MVAAAKQIKYFFYKFYFVFILYVYIVCNVIFFWKISEKYHL